MKNINENDIKLHLGCGNKHIDGYINIDIRYFSCFNASSSERFFFKNNILSLEGLGTL